MTCGIQTMDNMKVTVLMSVCNGEKYVRESVESILNQTFSEFEFLIIDDGSTDRSAGIIETFEDPRIRLVRNETNIGLTRSLNKGLSLARGEYIARTDCDDVSCPDRLKEQVEFLDRHPDVAVVGTGYEIIDDDGIRVGSDRKWKLPEGLYYHLTFHNCFAHSTLMFRATNLQDLGGYDETFEKSQDYELVYRLSRVYPLAMLDRMLVQWRNSKGSISSQFSERQYDDARRVFAGSMKSILGETTELDHVSCFLDSTFPARCPVRISKRSLVELERINESLAAKCPAWLNGTILQNYASYEFVRYLWLTFKQAQCRVLAGMLCHPFVWRRIAIFIKVLVKGYDEHK